MTRPTVKPDKKAVATTKPPTPMIEHTKTQSTDNTMWIVVYAKMVDDKEKGIKLAGIYLGGASTDKAEAEKIARECVNTLKGGTIMPRIYPSSGKQELPRIMDEADIFFKKKEDQMVEAAAIIARPAAKKK